MTQKSKNTAKEKFSVKIDRIVDLKNSSIRAIASVNIGEAFAIHGLCIVDSQKGIFVRMPQQSYLKDGKTVYSDIFHPITAEMRKELSDKVLNAYEQELNAGHNKSEEIQSGNETDDPEISM